MELIRTEIEGLLLVQPKVHSDNRGYFMESYNQRIYNELGLEYDFVQDNEALSNRGVVRGLHYQIDPWAQAKLVRVIRGAVVDVVLDIRSDSETYGKHFRIVLSEHNKTQLLIPRGFAHGYAVLENNTLFAYKCDNFYAPNAEKGIHPLDKNLNIDWGLEENEMIISSKDNNSPLFQDNRNLNIQK